MMMEQEQCCLPKWTQAKQLCFAEKRVTIKFSPVSLKKTRGLIQYFRIGDVRVSSSGNHTSQHHIVLVCMPQGTTYSFEIRPHSRFTLPKAYLGTQQSTAF